MDTVETILSVTLSIMICMSAVPLSSAAGLSVTARLQLQLKMSMCVTLVWGSVTLFTVTIHPRTDFAVLFSCSESFELRRQSRDTKRKKSGMENGKSGSPGNMGLLDQSSNKKVDSGLKKNCYAGYYFFGRMNLDVVTTALKFQHLFLFDIMKAFGITV